jgi:Mn2+/Fe2+ NRAMP family transporter
LGAVASLVAGQRAPPRTLRERLLYLGPGLIVTGSIVGSGELIITTGLGAKAGFILLWLIVLGCVIKVFVQLELGRFVVSEGVTTLAAMNRIPGPRLVVSWLVWLWAIMFVCLFFQLAGIIGSLAQVLGELGLRWSADALAIAVAASGAILLASGRYRLIESFSTLMVFLFTACTVVAVVALQWTAYRISPADIAEGARFRLPADLTWAFAAFGITGMGAAELIYYPYWCLEKGYARYVGPREPGPAWAERARGWVDVMRFDAWTSLVIYTVATGAFYFLGASVLHSKGLAVTNSELIPTLSHMYGETLGDPGLWVFLIGAFFVLYSTFFVATASNALLLADALSVFGLVRYSSPSGRRRVARAGCVLLPAIFAVICLSIPNPVSLVLAGALAQAFMLPLLALVALYLRYRATDERLLPGPAWTACLWAAFLAMTAIGAHEAYDKVHGLLFPAGAPAALPAGEKGGTP